MLFSFLRITRQERPWALCAIFLLFVLVTLYNEKNNPRMRVSQSTSGAEIGGTIRVKPTTTGEESLSGKDDSEHDNSKTLSSSSSSLVVDLTTLSNVPSTDFNFCTSPHVLLRDTNRTLDIPYQCDGPLYRSFIGQLRTFSDDLVTTGQVSATWGHRTALPSQRRYLFLGNSHTRQMAMALLCQLQVVHHSESLEDKNKAMARRYDLADGTQIYLVVNSHVVHSPQWVKLLQQQVGVPLHEFDALVLGVFNTCNAADANTTFAKDMQKLQDKESGVDCINQDGPSLKQVAAVYSGPLIYVSMFATYRYKTYSQDREDAKLLIQQEHRSNLLYLDGRQYLRMSSSLDECGSASRDAPSDCVHGEEARRYHHRCVGQYGGHPDLIAWDVIEFLYKHAAGK